MAHLSTRLKSLLDCIPPHSETLADIGCDHGKLVVAAILSGKAQKGIGVDISEQSLAKAVAYAESKGISDKIDFYRGNGFSSIKERISCAVIAGLGGNEISEILSYEHECDSYILSPHQDAHILREFMKKNGFCPKKDFVIYDKGKFYPIILATKGICDYTEQEIYIGKNLPPTEICRERNLRRLKYINNILENSKEKNKISEELLKEAEALELWQKSNMQ